MKLAVLTRKNDPFSLKIYRENVEKELSLLGIEIRSFTETGPIPEDCDLVWEPGLGMRGVPNIFKKVDLPVICTIHGLRAFSLPIIELAKSLKGLLYEYRMKLKVVHDWSWFRKKVSAVIAVSEYGAREVIHALSLKPAMVYPVYHGVDHSIFNAEGDKPDIERQYFIQVAQYQPIKNVDRIFEAYKKLSKNSRSDLMGILPGYQFKGNINGIKLIHNELSPIELAKWYRGAMGFVFPSLRESFGMPILEAMACGCPVITSNSTGCAEVAGEAALLVDPYSIDDIANAMKRLIEDEFLRQRLRQKGLERVQQFTWRKSAEEHLKVFEKVLSERK